MSRKEFIPTKHKKPTRLKLEKEKQEIPKDLEDLWGAVIAISTCHRMLQEGSFPFRYANAVAISIAFMTELHKDSLEKAAAHPQQELIPEIATLKAQQKVIDGEASKADQKNQ